MSKIIESLKTTEEKKEHLASAKIMSPKEPITPKPSPAKAEAPAKTEAPVREVSREKSGRELTQEQLAEIYFSATGKNRLAEPPVIIKVVEKPRFAALIPWIITSLAFLVTAFSLFSTKRIFVDVKVIDDKTMALNQYPPDLNTFARQIPSAMSLSNFSAKPNKIALDDFTFEGAAYLKSSKENNLLTLVNSSVAPFARAVKHFDYPLNLSKAKITFYVRGNKGGENIAVALKDQNNVQAFYKGKFYPFPNGLTADWQKAEITPADMTREFDLSAVTSIRFEFGSKDTANKPGDSVLIRDLQWVSP